MYYRVDYYPASSTPYQESVFRGLGEATRQALSPNPRKGQGAGVAGFIEITEK